MSLIEPRLTCKTLKRSRTVAGMGRILLIIAAVIAALVLLGPLLGFVFSLLKWILIIGAIFGVVVLGVTFLSTRAKRT